MRWAVWFWVLPAAIGPGFCAPGAPPALPVGGAAPAFALPDVHGRLIGMESGKRRVVVLNFWAFWCDTWKQELPQLKALAAEQEALGFRLTAISVDGTRLPEFWKDAGGEPPFPVLLDAGGRVSARYQVWRVPTVVIVRPDGRIAYIHSGYPGNPTMLYQIRRAWRSGGSGAF